MNTDEERQQKTHVVVDTPTEHREVITNRSPFSSIQYPLYTKYNIYSIYPALDIYMCLRVRWFRTESSLLPSQLLWNPSG
jgi:hypothetical protein